MPQLIVWCMIKKKNKKANLNLKWKNCLKFNSRLWKINLRIMLMKRNLNLILTKTKFIPKLQLNKTDHNLQSFQSKELIEIIISWILNLRTFIKELQIPMKTHWWLLIILTQLFKKEIVHFQLRWQLKVDRKKGWLLKFELEEIMDLILFCQVKLSPNKTQIGRVI